MMCAPRETSEKDISRCGPLMEKAPSTWKEGLRLDFEATACCFFLTKKCRDTAAAARSGNSGGFILTRASKSPVCARFIMFQRPVPNERCATRRWINSLHTTASADQARALSSLDSTQYGSVRSSRADTRRTAQDTESSLPSITCPATMGAPSE